MGHDFVHQCWHCPRHFSHRGELIDHIGADHAVVADADLPVADRVDGLVTVPLDPAGPPSQVVPVAVALARQAGFAVELVAAPVPGVQTASYLVARQREVTGTGVRTVSTRQLRGHPVDAVVDHATGGETRLLCLATRARGTLAEWVGTSLAAEVVRRSPVPVVLVGPDVPAPDPTGAPFRRLLVGVDGSEPADRAADIAVALGRRLGADIDLVEVVDPGRASDDTPSDELRRAVERLAPPPPSHGMLHGRNPALTLARHAGTEGDTLVVVGTHGSGPSGAPLGGVALGLARHGTVPVLVVPLGCADIPTRQVALAG